MCDIVVNKFTFAISSPDEFLLLDRFFRVDLMKPVSNVRLSVRPQKVSLISLKFVV